MNNQTINQVVACHMCDSLMPKPTVNKGQKAICPCCGTVILSHKTDSINRTIAIAIAGLLIYIPAILLPLVGISAAGTENKASLIDCVVLMINGQYYVVAFAVFMFTLAIPTVRIIAALYICLCIKFNKIKPSLRTFFRSYHSLDHWTMIHVFFMGVIVSMYKLISLADMIVYNGLFALLFLLICSTLISVTLDSHKVWETLEQPND